jgi:hypothetical protein
LTPAVTAIPTAAISTFSISAATASPCSIPAASAPPSGISTTPDDWNASIAGHPFNVTALDGTDSTWCVSPLSVQILTIDGLVCAYVGIAGVSGGASPDRQIHRV